MDLDLSVPLKDQREGQTLFVKVVNMEKQLWAAIHSNGPLHADVQGLYREVRSHYEKIILDYHAVMELQDVEYSLWKLHYKHIDEFRKRIRQASENADSKKSVTLRNDSNVQSKFGTLIEGFRSFLLNAAEFYQDLVTKLCRCCGLPEKPFFYKIDGLSCSNEPKKLHKYQYLCHRFLICLGDLARYRELYMKHDFQKCNWSLAATYYFEATIVWPDSGNPQNQLALLATYIGNDFLALYHCVRSLAIKEPFPDAWDNLILLFEKNRSRLHSSSSEAYFDFLKPSERVMSHSKSQSSKDTSDNCVLEASADLSSAKTNLWPLFVRMTSFFFIKSSLEDFSCTFASTVGELEALVALDGSELKTELESYQHMDQARGGPYRALQLVSVLIFIIHSLAKCSESKESKQKTDMPYPMLTQLAFSATFICMGRLSEVCMKGNSLDFCPILPAVLVFSEWLVFMLDTAETYCADEKVASAMSYFFGALADLVNHLDVDEDEIKQPDHTALWEDYELRGFEPLAHAQEFRNYKTHWQHIGNFNIGNACRARRISHAAMRISERSEDSGKLVFHDKVGSKFCTAKSMEKSDCREAMASESSSVVEVKEPRNNRGGTTKKYEKDGLVENSSHSDVHGNSVAVEDEEVILFKPITRYNSAPIYASITTNDSIATEAMVDQAEPSGGSLRRALSLFGAQSQVLTDPLSFYSDINNFRNSKPAKHPEPFSKGLAAYPAGPPSLSAWVPNGESLSIERERGEMNFTKHALSPIEEIASGSLSGLSICETEDYPFSSAHISATIHYPSPPYSAPLPSAPLLPDDAGWFAGNLPNFSDFKSSGGIKGTDGILGPLPSGYTYWSAAHGPFSFGPPVPGCNDVYSSPSPVMTSSEWLQHYTNNQSFAPGNTRAWPVPGDLGSFYGHDASRYYFLDRLGNPLASDQSVYSASPQLLQGSPLVYRTDEQREDISFLGYQRPSPYGFSAGMDLRIEQPQLLHSLKDREWQQQQESHVRGPSPTYIGH